MRSRTASRYALMKRARRAADRQSSPALTAAADVSVSVVIPTCNRPDDLRRCLAALEQQRRLPAPGDRRRRQRPGTGSPTPAVVARVPSSASHRGAEARSVVRAQRRHRRRDRRHHGRHRRRRDRAGGWLERLVAPFARPEVMAVTGHVLPLELETRVAVPVRSVRRPRQGLHAARGERRVVPRRARRRPTWKLGATANAAFRASHLRRPADRRARRGAGRRHADRLQRGHVSLLQDPEGGPHHRLRADRVGVASSSARRARAAAPDLFLQQGPRRLSPDDAAARRRSRALVRLFYSLPQDVREARLDARLRGRSDYPLSSDPRRDRRHARRPLGAVAVTPPRAAFGPGARPEQQHAVSLESPVSQTPAA